MIGELPLDFLNFLVQNLLSNLRRFNIFKWRGVAGMEAKQYKGMLSPPPSSSREEYNIPLRKLWEALNSLF